MADNRMMKEMLQAPTEGYGDAIVVPAILAENFEIRTGLHSLIQANQFQGFESNNPHDHIRSFNRIAWTLKFRDVPNDAIKLMLFPYSLEGADKIWYEKEPPRSILTWGDLTMSPPWIFGVAQINTFYHGLNEHEQDSLNVAAGGSLLRKTPHDALVIIENKLKVRYSRNKPVAFKASTTSSGNSSSMDARIDKLTDTISTLVETFNKKMTTPATIDNFKAGLKNKIHSLMQNQINSVKNELRSEISNQTNDLRNMMAGYFQMNTASSSGLGLLPSNTVPNPRADLKAITTRSGVTLAGPSV
nr:hypothetical protein [Tanacetum cinerariifolium]